MTDEEPQDPRRRCVSARQARERANRQAREIQDRATQRRHSNQTPKDTGWAGGDPRARLARTGIHYMRDRRHGAPPYRPAPTAGIQTKLRPLSTHYICQMAYIQQHSGQDCRQRDIKGVHCLPERQSALPSPSRNAVARLEATR